MNLMTTVQDAPITMHALCIGTFVPMLRSLSQIFDKAIEQAPGKGIDLAKLPEARLAPDMFPLTRQVQIACDMAKSAAARLTGAEPPRHEDNETTMDELKARIANTIAYMEGMQSEAFAGGEDRAILFPLIDDLVFDSDGFEYVRDWALPHFYFHVVTAYDILRHKGFDIGKRDYLSHAGPHIHPRS